jgi:hypothetical protein
MDLPINPGTEAVFYRLAAATPAFDPASNESDCSNQ